MGLTGFYPVPIPLTWQDFCAPDPREPPNKITSPRVATDAGHPYFLARETSEDLLTRTHPNTLTLNTEREQEATGRVA